MNKKSIPKNFWDAFLSSVLPPSSEYKLSNPFLSL